MGIIKVKVYSEFFGEKGFENALKSQVKRWKQR